MTQGISGITSLIAVIGALFSTGSNTVRSFRPTTAPTAQVQRVQCPPTTTPQIEQQADGSYRVVCVQAQAQRQQP